MSTGRSTVNTRGESGSCRYASGKEESKRGANDHAVLYLNRQFVGLSVPKSMATNQVRQEKVTFFQN
jgi:hypothetical protein